jgi:hypothetical protein
MTAKNSKTAPKKALILAMTKMRKRNSRNKKPVLISFANS